MAKWDLTTRIGAYLDRHLVFPLMEFLSGKGIFDEKELLKGKFELLKNTKMIDFAADIYKQIHEVDHAPEEMSQRRNEIVEKLKEYKEKLKPVIKVFSEEEVISQIQCLRDGKQLLDYLVNSWDFKESYIEMFYKYAKFQYECGNYSVTAEYLFFFRILVQPSDKNYLNCLWGKFASEILMQNWDVALDDLNRLKEYIESNTMYTSALHSLQQRAWLIHWSLFVFFNHDQGKDLIIEMCLLQPQYLNVIQTTCPHILRYLTAAVIINKQRRSVMKDLIKVIQQESYTYRDPITEFVECLYVNFDFDGAQQKLRECETVLGNDFFLVSCLDDFMENARLVIFETFCRIHECISISMLAEKLNMKPDAAERWIVNLIRNARLDAKIDSKLGHVVMGTQAVSPYQQLIEKTKALAFRTQLLTANVEKKINSSHPDRAFSHWGNQDF